MSVPGGEEVGLVVPGARESLRASTAVLVGTLDTKGEEYAFARERLEALGLNTLVVDTGILGAPGFEPDVTAAEVALAGGSNLGELRQVGDRAQALATMGRGTRCTLESLLSSGRIHGALALGGSGNTEIAATAFRGLPIGFPKMILTTMIGGDLRGLIGGTDIVLAQSVTDIAGLNGISRVMISNAAAALAGMVSSPPPEQAGGRPLIAASMIGLTSRAVTAARRRLEQLGCEVLVFHMTGLGGNTMESLIERHKIAGVLDLTTSELADDLGGGTCAAGPRRLTTATRRKIPQVVAPGGLDMVNFGAPDTVPVRYQGRPQHAHTAQVTLVRTDPAMSADLGRLLVDRLSGDGCDHGGGSDYRPVLLLPSGGFSAIDRPGQPFYDPVADEALRAAVRAQADPNRVRVLEVDGDLDTHKLGVFSAELLYQLVSQVDGPLEPPPLGQSEVSSV